MENKPIYNITAFTEDGQTLELVAIKKTRGVNDYLLNDKEYKALQFDCHDRPHHFEKKALPTRRFSGYLIGRKKKGVNKIISASFMFKIPVSNEL
jgi:hypothetical protein